MSFRFLKKKDGTKILQYKDMSTLEYKDVPMVEEEINKEKLMRAISQAMKTCEQYGYTSKLIILLSKRFHECLKMEHNGLDIPFISDITSIMGHNAYVIDVPMSSGFKILREV